MTIRLRPTLRCLVEDLHVVVPPVTTPLDEVDHVLVAKAVQDFADETRARERIRAIDDRVFFKAKIQRWRGAVWVEDRVQPWLVAAGRRAAGDADDFYLLLVALARRARNRHNSTSASPLIRTTCTDELMPTDEDHARYDAEASGRFLRRVQRMLDGLVRDSLADGREHSGRLIDGCHVGVLVRVDAGHETYVAIRIIGSVPANLAEIVLIRTPGCDPEGWFPESRIHARPNRPGEQVWSNVMDPQIAAKLLGDEALTRVIAATPRGSDRNSSRPTANRTLTRPRTGSRSPRTRSARRSRSR